MDFRRGKRIDKKVSFGYFDFRDATKQGKLIVAGR
jgi:hypothetical protein